MKQSEIGHTCSVALWLRECRINAYADFLGRDVVGKWMIWRRTLHCSDEGLIHHWIPGGTQQHRFRQFAIPSDGKTDNRYAYSPVIRDKRWHGKGCFNFALQA